MSETGKFIIPRATGTHGDVFVAVGLADLLASAERAREVQIVETSRGFEVRPSLDGDEYGAFPQIPGYPFLKASPKVVVPKKVGDWVDYAREKQKADRRKKLIQGKKLKSLGADAEQLLKQDELRPDWRLLQVLNTLQGDETSNRLHALIAGMKADEFSQAIAGALGALADSRPSGLQWPANSVQLFAPIAAKGYSRLKPDSTDRNDKTKEQWTDPFVEWLRYRGYFAVACPFFHGSRAENVRLLCPVPRNLSLKALRAVTDELRAAGIFGGPPKLDSLAVLKLAELLIKRSEEYAATLATSPIPGCRLFGKSPADLVSGVCVTNYQSLGNAKAVSSLAVIALPGWFVVSSAEEARAFLDILDEHQRVIRSLREDRSDEIGLLLGYRGFLQARGEAAVTTLFDFMARYGAFVLRAREQKRRIPQFTTESLEKLVMKNAEPLSAILTDPGFSAVAAAIRNATVNAQAQKAMDRDYRDIRYDLIPDLRRKSGLPGNSPLIEVISRFISLYNVENARRWELKKPAPRNVTTEEFAAVVRLIDAYGAATVGPMLCAYASCRLPKREETGVAAGEPEAAADEQE